jgi:hypothetical protein
MPVWNADEVAAACDLGIFDKEAKAVHMKRFEYYGEIARSIFKHSSQMNSDEKLKNEIEYWLATAEFTLILKALKSGFLSMEFPKDNLMY